MTNTSNNILVHPDELVSNKTKYPEWSKKFKPKPEDFDVEPDHKTHVVGSAWRILMSLEDGVEMTLERFIDDNFETIKRNAEEKIQQKEKEKARHRASASGGGEKRVEKKFEGFIPNRKKFTGNDDTSDGGSVSSTGKKSRDSFSFHTKEGSELLGFLKKQGESSQRQADFLEKYLEVKKRVQSFALNLDKEDVSDEIHFSFAELTRNLLMYMSGVGI